MRRRGGVLFGMVVLGLVYTASALSLALNEQRVESSPASFASDHQLTVNRYCVACHSRSLMTGDVVLEGLEVADVGRDAEMWERVVRKLRAGAMPPIGMPRPDDVAYSGLIGWLEEGLDRAAAAAPNPGRPLLRRLNRTEYANAIRDLLGIEVDAAALLPPDNSAFGFDNIADVLGSSPSLLQGYLAAARKISAAATGDPRNGVGSDIYQVRQDLSQNEHLDDLPLGTVGGMRVQHLFTRDGVYEFQVRLFRTNLSAIRGLEDPQQLEVDIDGERVHLADMGGNEDLIALQTNPTDASDTLEDERLRFRLFVRAGQRVVVASFLEKVPTQFETLRLQRFVRDFNPYDAEGAPHVQSLLIQGPFEETESLDAMNSRVFICYPDNVVDETPCARHILETLARRAYSRPLTAEELDDLFSFYERERALGGGFREGIQFALRRILISSHFIFRPEREIVDRPPGTIYRITDLELASRLSLFLWSSIPDDELLETAIQGRLGSPGILAQQVRRMLADSRSEEFVRNFTGQWLHLRNLNGIVPDSDTFPDFNDNLRQAFRREAELFFGSIIEEDRSVLDLMTADYTFVNESLAKHYEIPRVLGSHFRRVQLADEVRWGLLGKGAVLLVTSHPNITSPVLRGKWILENLLGTPPPAPPADLDTGLQEEETGDPLRTHRERLERHRTNPACSSCHGLMDPIGFVMENFDADGSWRTTDRFGGKIDVADVLIDGTKVNGVTELRQALLRRPEVFVGTLTEKLLTYAIGRGLTHLDMPAVRRIVRDVQQQDYRFVELILHIVNSAPFQQRIVPVHEASGNIVAAHHIGDGVP